jgi:isopenicillin N synthase-like dioxygenase
MAEIALIDASLPVEELAKHVGPAAEHLGFLHLSGTGLEHKAARMFAISKGFFLQSTDADKAQCSIANNKGYARMGQEALDPTKPDAKECGNR